MHIPWAAKVGVEYMETMFLPEEVDNGHFLLCFCPNQITLGRFGAPRATTTYYGEAACEYLPINLISESIPLVAIIQKARLGFGSAIKALLRTHSCLAYADVNIREERQGCAFGLGPAPALTLNHLLLNSYLLLLQHQLEHTI